LGRLTRTFGVDFDSNAAGGRFYEFVAEG